LRGWAGTALAQAIGSTLAGTLVIAWTYAGAVGLKVRLGGGKKERQLSAGPILPHQSAARPQERNHGRRRLYPHRIYHMLEDGTMYKDLGRNHFDRRSSDQQKIV
jgi:hypothetical protein